MHRVRTNAMVPDPVDCTFDDNHYRTIPFEPRPYGYSTDLFHFYLFLFIFFAAETSLGLI